MKKNSILFSSMDKEDCWVSCGLSFKIDLPTDDSFEETYEKLKTKLESKEIVDFVIGDNYLEIDLFKNDKTFKFKKTYWDYALIYVFENEDGEEVEFVFEQTDYILTN